MAGDKNLRDPTLMEDEVLEMEDTDKSASELLDENEDADVPSLGDLV